MAVNKERIELWAQALESGNYTKCVNTLWIPALRMHCALGVGMEVAVQHGLDLDMLDWAGSSFPMRVKEWYGLSSPDPVLGDGMSSVVVMNDETGSSFWDIAQAIRTEYLKDKGNG
jgi:hypothetical protein